MGAKARRWDDLRPRLLSAAVMLALGGGALWAGGAWFQALAALGCGAMIWELARMLAPRRPADAAMLGIVAAIGVMFSALGSGLVGLGTLLAVPLVGALALGQERLGGRGRLIFLGYGAAIIAAAIALVMIRLGLGAGWLLWLLAVVIATDVAGYFAGKILGGPKVLPRISPKKTWSGTLAGWLGAALVGAALGPMLPVAPGLPVAGALLLSLAAQAGDMAESAIKRAAGVKDSSGLIPGHGGLLDRFDGLIGAAPGLLVLLWLAARLWPAGS